jgi:hypothetical protein
MFCNLSIRTLVPRQLHNLDCVLPSASSVPTINTGHHPFTASCLPIFGISQRSQQCRQTEPCEKYRHQSGHIHNLYLRCEVEAACELGDRGRAYQACSHQAPSYIVPLEAPFLLPLFPYSNILSQTGGLVKPL